MRKPKFQTFEELVSENKREILRDEEQREKVESKWEKRRQDK